MTYSPSNLTSTLVEISSNTSSISSSFYALNSKVESLINLAWYSDKAFWGTLVAALLPIIFSLYLWLRGEIKSRNEKCWELDSKVHEIETEINQIDTNIKLVESTISSLQSSINGANAGLHFINFFNYLKYLYFQNITLYQIIDSELISSLFLESNRQCQHIVLNSKIQSENLDVLFTMYNKNIDRILLYGAKVKDPTEVLVTEMNRVVNVLTDFKFNIVKYKVTLERIIDEIKNYKNANFK